MKRVKKAVGLCRARSLHRTESGEYLLSPMIADEEADIATISSDEDMFSNEKGDHITNKAKEQ